MRTKTLLLTAALGAAGVATSMAQVYSVNMVGYINKQIPVGFSMIANQLNNTPDNKVTTLLPAPPNGTTVYKFNGSGYDVIQYLGAWEGDDLNMTLNPGEGAFIGTTTAFNNTFVGEVVLTSSVPLRQGFSVISSVLPQSLPLTAATPGAGANTHLNFPVQNGDTVYQFTGSGYQVDQYLSGAWEGDSGNVPPTPDIAESFFFGRTAAAGNWTRTFSVGP
jgi:hypothetical protein